MKHKIRVGVDIGGTFTDCVVIDESGKINTFKESSTPEDQSIGLYNVINKVASLKNSVAGSNVVLTTDLPSETLKMATAVMATGPIILLYPFVQKYFVAGLTVGAVKG